MRAAPARPTCTRCRAICNKIRDALVRGAAVKSSVYLMNMDLCGHNRTFALLFVFLNVISSKYIEMNLKCSLY